MERGRTGERYFLGGENLPFRVFARRVAEVAGARPPRLALPYAVLFPFAVAGSGLGRLMPGRFRDFNLAVLQSGALEHYATSRKACTELGFRELPVSQAIADALAWFVEHGYMPAPRKFAAGYCHGTSI
jgi:dihydroflavonol-4-reductase